MVTFTGATSPRRQAVINLGAFRHNVRVLSELAAPAQTMIAVKADAYGHGMIPIARAALDAGASSLAVLDIPAALTLREAGIQAPLFAWMHDLDADFAAAAQADIDLGVSAQWQLERIEETAGPHTPRVHLKVDTGLSRNGATREEWPLLVRAALEAQERGALRVHAAWSHLADTSPDEDRLAYNRFLEAVAEAESLGARFDALHLAASSAGIDFPEARFDCVRFGIAAYGISPFDDRSGSDLGLRPVMTLQSSVALTKRVPEGHGVSYGFTYETSQPTTLALVPVGYADGIPRISSGRGQVGIAGRRYPVVGRVAMDQVVVDVGKETVEPGDEVVIFGEAAAGVPTAEEWADSADTIGDEIVARVGPRMDRVYTESFELADLLDRETVIPDADTMHSLGRALGRQLRQGEVVVLTGSLGAGKTTLTRGIGEALHVRGPVTSPTFVLARTHPSEVGGPALVHVDAYRLADAAELADLDLDFDHSITVVEWGRGLLDGLVDRYLHVQIDRAVASWSESDTFDEETDDPRVVQITWEGIS